MNTRLDLSGQRFGKLVALKQTDFTTRFGNLVHAWKCLCECGKSATVRVQSLRNGATRSCGCLTKIAGDKRRIDMTGRTFGRLTVLGASEERSRKGLILWECLCSCGSTRRVYGTGLRRGLSESCGCLRVEMSSARSTGKSPAGKLPLGESRFNALIEKYKRRGAQFGHAWELTRDDARQLFTSNCYYCNCVPKHVIRGTRANGEFIYNGIDRLDSTKNYASGNVVSCCGDCNKAKLALSKSDFLGLVERIYCNRVSQSIGMRSYEGG